MTASTDPAETFRQEARDLLDTLEQTLLDLDRDTGNRDLVDTAFRAHDLRPPPRRVGRAGDRGLRPHPVGAAAGLSFRLRSMGLATR